MKFDLNRMFRWGVVIIIPIIVVFLLYVAKNFSYNNDINIFDLEKKSKELQLQLKQLEDFKVRMALREDILKRLPTSLYTGEKIVLSEAILDASIRHKIPTDVILAVIEVESRFIKGEPSPAGARGYMQIMPATYNSVAKKHNVVGDVDDTYSNIMVGVAYLNDLKEEYSKKKLTEGALWIMILNAYNTGQPSLQTTSYTRDVIGRVNG